MVCAVVWSGCKELKEDYNNYILRVNGDLSFIWGLASFAYWYGMSKIVGEAMEKEERADGFLSTGKSEMIETSKIDVRWAASFKHSVETTGGEASGSDCLEMEETWSSNTMVMAMVTAVERGR
ncbi:hypothetical protein GW17_00051027 [Ensete ventricosum]|nr:hypothetical protein GW17_00051027 [Ensete ventricosum]